MVKVQLTIDLVAPKVRRLRAMQRAGASVLLAPTDVAPIGVWLAT